MIWRKIQKGLLFAGMLLLMAGKASALPTIVNVKSHGVNITNVDNGPAIEAMIALYAGSATETDPVIFEFNEAGVYNMSSSIRVRSNLQFRGLGKTQTTIKAINNVITNQTAAASQFFNYHLFRYLDQTTEVKNVKIENFTLDCNYSGSPNAACNFGAVSLWGANNRLENCAIKGFGKGSHASAPEAFVVHMKLHKDSASNAQGAIIRYCDFSDPAPMAEINTNGAPVTLLLASGFNGHDGLAAPNYTSPNYASGILIEQNTFTNIFIRTDDISTTVDPFPGPYHGITIGTSFGSIIRSNTFTKFDSRCIYSDTSRNDYAEIYGNVMNDVHTGMRFTHTQAAEPTDNAISCLRYSVIYSNIINLYKERPTNSVWQIVSNAGRPVGISFYGEGINPDGYPRTRGNAAYTPFYDITIYGNKITGRDKLWRTTTNNWSCYGITLEARNNTATNYPSVCWDQFLVMDNYITIKTNNAYDPVFATNGYHQGAYRHFTSLVFMPYPHAFRDAAYVQSNNRFEDDTGEIIDLTINTDGYGGISSQDSDP